MRKALCLLCLLVFGDCLAARADSLVLVTIDGWYHNFDNQFSLTFSFDPARVYTSSAQGFETDFLYPLLTSVDFPSPNSLNVADFFDSGSQLGLFSTTNPSEGFLIEFGGGSRPTPCQNIPSLAVSGVVPTFTTTSCSVTFFEDVFSPGGTEAVNAISSVDFVVQGSATTPEPSNLILVGFGLTGLFQISFHRKKAAPKA